MKKTWSFDQQQQQRKFLKRFKIKEWVGNSYCNSDRTWKNKKNCHTLPSKSRPNLFSGGWTVTWTKYIQIVKYLNILDPNIYSDICLYQFSIWIYFQGGWTVTWTKLTGMISWQTWGANIVRGRWVLLTVVVHLPLSLLLPPNLSLLPPLIWHFCSHQRALLPPLICIICPPIIFSMYGSMYKLKSESDCVSCSSGQGGRPS